MYKRILLAYDGSEPGQKALLDTKEIALITKAEVYLIAVMPPAAAFMGGEGYVYDKEAEDEERRQHQATLDEGLGRLVEAGGHRASGELVVGEAVDEITRYAKKIDADLIVVGHKHLASWAARWWRGSVSKALIEHAPCSVLVAITK
jgi:nucleotide-binding universal stress UspA family protein